MLPIAIGAVLCLSIPLVWLVASRIVPAGSLPELSDLVSIPVVFDSHEKVFNECLEIREENLREFVESTTIDEQYIAEARVDRDRTEQQSKELLVRLIRLGPPTPEQKESFDSRLQAMTEAYESRVRERGRAMTEADQQLLSQITPQDQQSDLVFHTLALASYLQSGMSDVPPPDHEKEQVYVDQLELIRESITVLAAVSSQSDLSAAAADIEGLADRMLEVAVARSRMQGAFDFVNREYIKIDRTLTLTASSLQRRIAADIGTDPVFETALENFELTRDLIDEAAGGVEETDLRARLAEARDPSLRQPETLVASTEPVDTAAPDPAPQPSSNTPEPTVPDPPSQEVATNEPDRRPGFSGRPEFRGPSGRPPGMGSPFGTGGRGPTSPARSDGRTAFEQSRARFSGPDSAKLIFRTPDNLKSFCDDLMGEMGISDYLMHASNGEATLYMKYEGTLEELAVAVTGATVISTNRDSRELRVEFE